MAKSAVPHKLVTQLAEILVEMPQRDRASFLRDLIRETNELLSFYEDHADILISEQDLQTSPAAFGVYQKVRLLGEGSMGQVFEAWDTRNQRKVAVKTIKPGLLMDRRNRERFWKRFKREARICRRLNHPHIVALYDYVENQQPYIVLEYVAGTTLAHWLVEDVRRDRGVIMSIVSQICDALTHAHHAGVVHRDLKPSNILIDDNNGVKLTDFGIGKLMGIRSLTQSGFIGTPLYAAPEQVNGDAMGRGVDLFALALVIHVLVTGLHPFRGESLEQTLYNIANKEPLLSLPNPRYGLNPAGWKTFMTQALAKDPKHRYLGAGDFYSAFFEIAE